VAGVGVADGGYVGLTPAIQKMGGGKMNTIKKVGFDGGFGYFKAVEFDEETGEFKTVIIRAVLGRGARVENIDLGLGGKKRHRLFKVSYEGEEYLVGEDAILHSQTGLQATQTFGRIGSDEERILLLATLAKGGLSDVAIVTGLPVLAKGKKRALRKSWIGTHDFVYNGKPLEITIHDVKVTWQPILSLWDHFLTIKDGKAALGNGMKNGDLRAGWLVVDVGYNTTDRAGVKGLTIIDKYSGGGQKGGRTILGVIVKHLENEYGVSKSLAELEEALRGDGYIDIYDERVDLKEIGESAATSVAAEIASDVAGGIGDGSQFRGIILTGGPAEMIRVPVQKACPRNAVSVRPQPQIANARGGCKYAHTPGLFGDI